jgi:hypothetical protein
VYRRATAVTGFFDPDFFDPDFADTALVVDVRDWAVAPVFADTADFVNALDLVGPLAFVDTLAFKVEADFVDEPDFVDESDAELAEDLCAVDAVFAAPVVDAVLDDVRRCVDFL